MTPLPPRRDGRAWPVALALLLVLGLVAWFGLRWLGTPRLEDDQGREIAARFLGEIREGRVDSAWAGASTEFKSLMGQDYLRDYVKRHPALREPAEFASSEPSPRNGLPMTEYAFRATGRKGGSIRVLVANEGGTWKVERLGVE